MARKKRVWYPGAVYHVMSRGNKRDIIYKDHYDYVRFIDTLKVVQAKYHFLIHALCLMTNHFHLELETTDVDLSTIMQLLLSKYTSYYKSRHKSSGHLFEGRYTANIIESDSYFLEVSRYIHLNPVKAMMVIEPIAYKYSSYGLYIPHHKSSNNNGKAHLIMSHDYNLNKRISEITETSRILSLFQSKSKQKYRLFVEDQLSHEAAENRIRNEIKEDEMWMR